MTNKNIKEEWNLMNRKNLEQYGLLQIMFESLAHIWYKLHMYVSVDSYCRDCEQL